MVTTGDYELDSRTMGNGVQGVAGSNPAVPTGLTRSAVGNCAGGALCFPDPPGTPMDRLARSSHWAADPPGAAEQPRAGPPAWSGAAPTPYALAASPAAAAR